MADTLYQVIALYSFGARNGNELTIKENETLFVCRFYSVLSLSLPFYPIVTLFEKKMNFIIFLSNMMQR